MGLAMFSTWCDSRVASHPLARTLRQRPEHDANRVRLGQYAVFWESYSVRFVTSTK